MDNYTHYVEYTRSGRKAVFQLLNENPHLSFLALKEKLHEKNIKLEDQTIRNYMSNWRLYSRNGRVPRLHFGLGRLDSGFGVGLWDAAPSFGWKESKNKNRCRRMFKSGVWLDWHRNGTIVFRFKGALPQHYLMGVFSQAFWDMVKYSGKPEREISDYLRVLFKERYHQVSRHSVYETGAPLPKTVIDRKRSHGEIIKLGDGSHPTSVEVEETEPFWASGLKDAAVHMAENLRSHVQVMRETRKAVAGLELVTRRILAPITHFDDASIQKIETIQIPDSGWCARCGQRAVLYFSVHSIDSQGHGFDGAICRDCIRALREKAPLRLRRILDGAIGQRRLRRHH